ncbi:MAG: hypothetical protein AAGH15_26615, partial [Myxococcota bacterium]
MRSLIALALLAAACAGGGRSAETFEVPRLPTAGEVLVSALPAGADHCVVARPGRLGPARRQQIVPLSHATAFAWDTDAPVGEAAEVRQDGSGAPAVELRLRVGDMEEARRWLAERAPFRVRWGDVDCPGSGCQRWRADAPDARTIRLRRGLWKTDVARTGVRARCQALSARFPGAYEVGVHAERGWLGAWDHRGEGPGTTREVALFPLDGGFDGVRWREVFRSGEMTPEELLAGLAAEAFGEPPHAESAARRHGPAEGPDGIESGADYRWEDLALAVEDARRLREAAAAEARASVPLDPERVRVEDREVLERQLALRRRALDAGDGAELPALRRLLERGLDAH